MIGRYWIIALGIAALQLGGCGTAPALDTDYWSSGATKREFVQKHKQMARSYESDGSLQHALQEWLIISAVVPVASEPRTEVDRLEKLIASAVRKQQFAAKAAIAKSDYGRAQLQLLKILALQPDNPHAFGELKKLELRRTYAGLARAPKVSGKAIQAYAVPRMRPGESKDGSSDSGNAPGSIGNAKKTPPVGSSGGKGNLQLALGHLSNREYEAALERFMLAQKLKEAPAPILEKHIADMRSALAERHYDNGVSAFRAARYDQAVSEFKKALGYDPEHQKARLYLGSASELQMRMEP